MRLAVGLMGGAILVATLGVGGWLGADWLHLAPQPRTQLTVRLDTDAVASQVARSLLAAVRDGVRESRIGTAAMASAGDSIDVTIAEGVDRGVALAALRELSRMPGSTGGSQVERFTVTDTGEAVRLTPTPAAMAHGVSRALDRTVDVLRQRLEGPRLKPALRREGDDRIVISVPGQPDAARLEALIVAPGRLTLRAVDMSVSVEEAKSGRMPPQSEILPDREGLPYLVEKRIAMPGEDLADAQPSFEQRTNQAVVMFRFNAAGTRRFARLTEQSVGLPLAVVLDGVVLAAPIIREPILSGSGQISGNFTMESANSLAVLLRSGALPAPLTVIEARTL